MRNEEEKIKEQRSIEATKKDLMGSDGKLMKILKWLGEPIKSEGAGMWHVNYMEDFYQTDEDEIPTLDEEAEIYISGYLFSGLSRGMQLELMFIEDQKELTVHYEGYLVYQEVSGNLTAYVPSNEWEDKINTLYVMANKRRAKELKVEKEIRRQEIDKRKNSWLETLRERWGL